MRSSSVKSEPNKNVYLKCEPLDITGMVSPKSQFSKIFENVAYSNDDKLKVNILFVSQYG